MTRQSNGTSERRGRGSMRGRAFMGRGGRGIGSMRGGHKPPPLMARPMHPASHMRLNILEPSRPLLRPGMGDFGRMGPPRLPLPRPSMPRGEFSLRMGARGRGSRPPLRGMIPSPRLRGPHGLLPPPMPIPRHLGPGMFPHRPPMPPDMMYPLSMRGAGMSGRMLRGGPRGRGMFANFGTNNRKVGKPGRGRGTKGKTVGSPSGELNKPWVTEDIKNEILKKHKLHMKAKKARTKEDWEIFKEHRNKVTTMLREAKLEYIGAHPEEDVDKILAEATTKVSDKDETKEATADIEGSGPAPVVEGAEPMEEEGGACEATHPPDPELDMNQESLTEPQNTKTDPV